MTLHILGPGFSSLVRTVRLYSLEKGLDATFGMTLDGQAVGLRSETHRRLHPFGQLPVLVHDDRHVFETVAICRYLDQVFPPRIASDPERELLVDQWASALATTVDRCLIRDYLLKVAGRKPDPDFDPKAFLSDAWGIIGSENPPTVTVRFAAEAAYRVLEGGFPNATLIRRDGCVEVEFRAGTDKTGLPRELMPFLLGWGPRAEVLSPPHVREAWLAELRETLARYDTPPARNTA